MGSRQRCGKGGRDGADGAMEVLARPSAGVSAVQNGPETAESSQFEQVLCCSRNRHPISAQRAADFAQFDAPALLRRRMVIPTPSGPLGARRESCGARENAFAAQAAPGLIGAAAWLTRSRILTRP